MTVVAGNDTVEFSNDAPGAIVRAVPLSVKLQRCISPSAGVPTSPVVREVILTARPVIFVTSELSVLLPGVADDATISTRFVTRLFVTVAKEEVVRTSIPSTAIFQAAERVIDVSVFPISIWVMV